MGVTRAELPDPEDLARRWWRPVYGVALSLTGRAADAEDLTQEAFLRAFRALRTLRRADRVGPWLVKIVKNAARDRARRKRPRTLADAAERLPAGDDPEFEEATVEAWRRLPEDERLVVWLKVVDGLTIRALADLLGTSKSSVDRTLRKGLARLRKEVARC